MSGDIHQGAKNSLVKNNIAYVPKLCDMGLGIGRSLELNAAVSGTTIHDERLLHGWLE